MIDRSGFERFQFEHLRLAILQILAEVPQYTQNEYLLNRALEAIGHGAPFDRLRTELAWLREQGLAEVREKAGGLQVARLTRRGHDVARGKAQVPGVARPRPEE